MTQAVDARRLRDVAAAFATGVTIITTSDDSEHHGCAANAVTSLSLDPPLMLLCLDHAAKTHAKAIAARKFAINILRAGEESERICRLFAGKGERKFEGLAWRPGATGVPILEAAFAWVECRLERTYEGGDHTIFIGRVVSADALDDEPLIFYRGRFRRLIAVG
ncbi:MAG: flavin reductase [bacterium]|nr:flavin reductase [bacterium]